VGDRSVTEQTLYLSHAEAIENAIRIVSRRHRLSGPDAEDFASSVRVKLLEDDCAVLRGFQQRSSIQTFLVAVVQRHCLDHRNKSWGKWRPSATAKRLGPLAMQLERMLYRDGLSFDQAVETLRTNHRLSLETAELDQIRRQLPDRPPRRFVGEDLLEDVPLLHPDPESLAARATGQRVLQECSAAIDGALGQLEPSDALLIRMRFYDGLTVARIARILHADQKPLYRRLERALGRVRSALEVAGFQESEIGQVLREGIACE
jgi:RNA polymerase sigma factor (sigma-70 family)